MVLHDLVPEGGWAKKRMPLISPLGQGKGIGKNITGLLGRGSGVSATNLFLTMARRPFVFMFWLLYSSSLMPYGKLKRKQTEMVILRCAWLARSRYEWNQHVVIGTKAGLTETEIHCITQTLKEENWDAPSFLLLKACDEYFADAEVSEMTMKKLGETFKDQELMEVVLLIAQYFALAGVLQSLGIQVEGDS